LVVLQALVTDDHQFPANTFRLNPDVSRFPFTDWAEGSTQKKDVTFPIGVSTFAKWWGVIAWDPDNGVVLASPADDAMALDIEAIDLARPSEIGLVFRGANHIKVQAPAFAIGGELGCSGVGQPDTNGVGLVWVAVDPGA
jgi:hypothetical protein